jgi:DNA-binding NtrC family response regulator
LPKLIVLPLTDSFSGLWPTLASELGLTLSTITDPKSFHGVSDAVGLVSAGGAEEELENVFHQISGADVEVSAIGALADHRLAGAAVRVGAAMYFALPGDQELVRSWLRERAEWLRARTSRSAFAAAEAARYRFEGIRGDSPALHAALERAARIIPHGSVTVLLNGETGTGKELFARAIHYNGPRREAPFVDVNCAAIPDQLLESELFGHEKGAFTDASAAKPGLFELANGGTLFLDEIGHLPLTLQGKLLRALEERQIRRVGGAKAIAVDVRIIAATHVDLGVAAKRGEFREDLFHRLNVVPIVLPPLRARRTDVPGLARFFLSRFAKEYGIDEPQLSPAAERALAARDWPGNVRELRNVMERTVLLTTKRVLGPEDFAEEARPEGAGTNGLPFPATLSEITHAAALAMLELTGGNKSVASRRLGISRPRLQRILDALPDDENNSDDSED